MDETYVWSDMISNNRQASSEICLKITRYEKRMVSVCLAAKPDGAKLKPFVVFRAAKRESKSLDEEFKSCCAVKSSGNAWMNEGTNYHLGKTSFRCLFRNLFRTCECHMTDSVRKDLKEVNVDSMIIPCRCTKYIQALDVRRNKPFKTR